MENLEGSDARAVEPAGTRRSAVRKWGLLVLVMALGAWAGWGLLEFQGQRAAFPLLEGRLALAGLESPVQVDRDGQGIPHVSAENERDGWLALGFVHAQDRLGQMLWLRALAQGRSAESLGAAGLPWDRIARTLDFRGLAVEQYPRLRADVQVVLKAYASGVNARLARIRKGEVAPPVFARRAALSLEDWKPEDSLALLKLYGWGAGESLEAGLMLGELIERFGASRATSFLPGGKFTALPELGGREPGSPNGLPSPASGTRPVPVSLPGFQAGGSAWLISGEHAEGGRPLLLAEVHTAPTAPALMHLDRLRAGSFDVVGATLPGVPVFWIGRNRHLAWAGLKAPVVNGDLYQEILGAVDPRYYHDARGWQRLDEREEVLRVRGGKDETLRVRSTGHGPLLPQSLAESPLAISWVGDRVQGPSGIASMLDVARARSAKEVVGALETHVEPPLLVAYADSEGVAGLQMAGWLPSRSLSSRLMPLPGRVRWYDWKERIPYRALPTIRLGADRGWLVAGEGALEALNADSRIEWLPRQAQRGPGVESLLREAIESDAVNLQELSRLESGGHDARALANLQSALRLVEASGEPAASRESLEFAQLLEGWDGRVSSDSVGAAAYHLLTTQLVRRLLGGIMGEDLAARYRALPLTDPVSLVYGLLEVANQERASGRSSDWRPYAQAVRESLRESWLLLSYRLGSNLRRWTWGRLHVLRVESFGGLDSVLGSEFESSAFPYPGSSDTVQWAAYADSGEFRVTSAATLRFAADAGALDQGLVALAPGQSEHPGHPHFGDGLQPWRAGQIGLLVSGGLLVESSSVHRLTLEPEF